MLGIHWTPISVRVGSVEQIYLQSSALSPHSTGIRTGKLLAFPQGLQSGRPSQLSSPFWLQLAPEQGATVVGRI